MDDAVASWYPVPLWVVFSLLMSKDTVVIFCFLDRVDVGDRFFVCLLAPPMAVVVLMRPSALNRLVD